MKIKYLGHSCFKITDDKGISIVADPFDGTVGYKVPEVEADIVTCSHGHYDHNYTECIKGDYKLVNKVGEFYVRDINITGVLTHHDNSEGKKRGDNIVYVMDVDGIRVCHMGDLGHLLEDKQISLIRGVDVLLIPVGGYYTIDAGEAAKVVEQIKPGAVIPMHYKTPMVDFPIDGVESFLQIMGRWEMVHSNTIEITKDMLDGQRKVYVLKYD